MAYFWIILTESKKDQKQHLNPVVIFSMSLEYYNFHTKLNFAFEDTFPVRVYFATKQSKKLQP